VSTSLDPDKIVPVGSEIAVTVVEDLACREKI
jgi:hypothetical protein